MARWWDTDMASASQALYVDPSMALDVATTPDDAFTQNVLRYTAQQRDVDKQQVQQERSGFLGTLAGWYTNADKFLSDTPLVGGVWGASKAVGSAVWYPVDKLASGVHWLYSEAISQPLSTVILQYGKMEQDQRVGRFFEDWGESYDTAEHLSPGQAISNNLLTGVARGEGMMSNSLDLFLGESATQAMSQYMLPEDLKGDTDRRAYERLLYDSEYWRDKVGWTYTAGTGATDFALVIGADPTTYLTAGISSVVKGVRSVQLATKGGEVVRTRGPIADKALSAVGKKPETVEDVANGKKMQEFFDWVAEPSVITNAPRKTATEIEMHPIWGRGRRQNPFKAQYSQVLSNWAREDMEMGFRFMAGDNTVVAPLIERGGTILDDIGRLSENRVAVDSMKFDSAAIGYFAALEGRVPATAPQGLDLTLPQTREVALQEEAGRFFNRAEGVTDASAIDKAKFDAWKESKLNLIDNEFKLLEGQNNDLRRLLGANLGRDASDFSAIEATGFGGLARAYRMGSGSFTSSYKDAERAIANKMKDRRGRFTTEGYRKGFYGTPLRIVQSFNDRVPQGFVNHNESDAGDRVFEMLREVPGLGAERRAQLHDAYMIAGDKVSKSQALQAINAEVVKHMATNVKGLDGEVARVLSGLVETKVTETVSKLLGTTGRTFNPNKQAFSGAEREGVQGAGRRVDHIEDGEGWVLSPIAKTQLSQSDTLLPIREIERALDRASGAMQRVRKNGGSAIDATKIVADSFNGIWKASTLLRPAYLVRSTSDEIVASAVKFGFMSRILMDGGVGAKNWAFNRATRVGAVLGKTSHTPTTGGGIEKSIIKINDPDVIRAVNQRKAELHRELARTTDPLKQQTLKGEIDSLKVSKIKVSNALPVVSARIKMERELLENLEKDLADYQGRIARTQANLNKPPTLGSGPGSAAWTAMGNRMASYQDKIHAIQLQIDDHKQIIEEFTDYHNEIYRVALASEGKRLGTGDFEVPGFGRVPQAFSKEWQNPVARDQISSDSAMASIFARAESIDTQRMIQNGSWTYITPDQPNHMDSWLHAVNYQFAQDDLFLKVMEDPTGSVASAWLKTPEGKQHLHDLGPRARDPEGLIQDIGMTLDKYLPEDTGLRTKILNGEQVSEADLASRVSKADYPTVHGEEIAEKTAMSAKDTVGNVIDRVISKGFKRLGAIPSDVLSRHPTYLHFQEGRFKELMATELSYRQSVGKGADSITPSELQKMLEKSDQLARKDMSKIVYDPQRTTASEALRFITPFFSAHADSLARWGGLIAEKPQLTSRIAQIYNAPVATGMVTDEAGNKVGEDGYADIIDPSTGEKVGREFVPIDKRVLQFKAPWKQGKNFEGTVPIRIQAMNTILPGDPWWNPGSGPLVQVAGSKIAKTSPEIGDFLQFAKILPYGPTDTGDAIVPKYMRAVWDAYKGDDPDNEEYQKAYLAIWNKKQMEYYESGGEAKFDQKEIEREARNFLMLNVLEAWGSPAQMNNTPLTGTPYQFFVDQLGQMRKADPEDYRDKFLAKFGTEFGGFTASLTKSMGVAATISADKQAELYADEIAADPDMAQFWIGDIYNGGPFSQSVYQKQLNENFGARMAREKITAEEAIERSQTERGWYEYRTAVGYIDSLLIRNGFKSYAQKGAEGYLTAKRQVIDGISAKFPAWQDAFMTVDRGKVPDRIRSFEKALGSEKLASDPMRYEMPALARYLQGRREFKQILAQNGFQKLSYDVTGRPTGKSAVIGEAWEQFKMGLINENAAFGDLHNRYLTNDELQ
jgi:hypothetical protein